MVSWDRFWRFSGPQEGFGNPKFVILQHNILFSGKIENGGNLKPPGRNIPEQTPVVSAHQVPFWERKPLKARPSSRGRKCKNAESPFTRSNRISSKPFLMAVLPTMRAFVVRSALGYRGDLRFGGGSAAEGAGADVALRHISQKEWHTGARERCFR